MTEPLPVALVVDDAPANRDVLERLLTGAKFRVLGVGTGAAARKAVDSLANLALAMVDMKLPDIIGLELAVELRRRFPDVYLIIATMYDERSMMEDAFDKGCNVFLVKPHGFMEMYQRLTTVGLEAMRATPHTVIDQFGPRLFKKSTQQMPKIP